MFPLDGIITVLTIMLSFDFKSCNCNHDENDDNDNNNEERDNEINEQYLKDIMDAYYKVPEHINLQKLNRGNDLQRKEGQTGDDNTSEGI